VLHRLGLTVPTSVSAAAAKGEPLSACRHRFNIKEIDGALSQANVTISDRLRLKTATTRILKKVPSSLCAKIMIYAQHA
jgi:hypothetical protein